jgi:predicted NUDIX family phosphoesterase
MSEQVLVVPTAIFHDCGVFQGFLRAAEDQFVLHPGDSRRLRKQYAPIFDPANQKFMDREEAENDPSHKQLIPYVVMIRFGSIAAYRRCSEHGAMSRRGKRSIGFGGHINPCDVQGAMVGQLVMPGMPPNEHYEAGLMRELSADLRFTRQPSNWSLLTDGLLNDDSTESGRGHLGVVHILRLPGGADIRVRAEDIIDLQWQTAEVLKNDRKSFENWSQLYLDQLPDAAPVRSKLDVSLYRH